MVCLQAYCTVIPYSSCSLLLLLLLLLQLLSACCRLLPDAVAVFALVRFVMHSFSVSDLHLLLLQGCMYRR